MYVVFLIIAHFIVDVVSLNHHTPKNEQFDLPKMFNVISPVWHCWEITLGMSSKYRRVLENLFDIPFKGGAAR